MSRGSPKISLSTTLNTRAGAQASANRPPLTADSRLRMVLISTISAPAGQKLPGDILQLAGGQKGLFQQGAAPARKQKQHPVPGRKAMHQRQRPPGGVKAGLVGHGVPRLTADHPGQFPPDMAVLGNDDARIHMAQTVQGGAGHLPGGLAGGHQHHPAAAGVETAPGPGHRRIGQDRLDTGPDDGVGCLSQRSIHIPNLLLPIRLYPNTNGRGRPAFLCESFVKNRPLPLFLRSLSKTSCISSPVPVP